MWVLHQSVRPGFLNLNLCTSLGLIVCLFSLCNQTRAESRATFVLNYLKNMVFLVLPYVNLCQGMHVGFLEGRRDVLLVSSSGTCLLEPFLQQVHRGIATAWATEWSRMFADGKLSADWNQEPHVVDMVVFLATLERFRRSKGKPLLGQLSVQLLNQLKDWMANFLAFALDQCLLTSHVAAEGVEDQRRQAPPARKFRRIMLRLLVSKTNYLP